MLKYYVLLFFPFRLLVFKFFVLKKKKNFLFTLTWKFAELFIQQEYVKRSNWIYTRVTLPSPSPFFTLFSYSFQERFSFRSRTRAAVDCPPVRLWRVKKFIVTVRLTGRFDTANDLYGIRSLASHFFTYVHTKLRFWHHLTARVV